MKSKIRLFAIGLVTVASLAGCASSETLTQDFTITSQQLQAVKSMPKIPAYTVQGNLSEIAQFGTQTQGALPWQRVLGTVEDVLAPVEVPIDGQETPGLWVPVVINVEQSDPSLVNPTVTLRVYPYSEHAPDLTRLVKGQRVLAVGTGPYKDSTGILAVSLGWLLDVAADGSVTDMYAEHKLTGKFNDVADLLNMDKLG